MCAQKIFQLDQAVIRRISAGEVIHYPSNVVKELLENAIDADSSRISVAITNGGFSSIKITDNGTGINKEDFPVACRRHTTSKIHEFKDLRTVSTFGFRGEALFSMSCVAHMTISSKTEDESLGYTASFEDGELLGDVDYIPLTRGTTVQITDLFYNNPNKLRVIPDTASQNKKILLTIQHYAIALPHISFSILIDGKEKLITVGNASHEAVLSLVYGTKFAESYFKFDAELGTNISVNAFFGSPACPKQIRDSVVFINGRLVQCEHLKRRVNQQYQQYLMRGEKPFQFVMLQMPHQSVDVNVHPTKKDVIFSNEDLIIDHLCDALYEELKSRAKVRKVDLTKKVKNQTSIESSLPRIISSETYTKAKPESVSEKPYKEPPPQSEFIPASRMIEIPTNTEKNEKAFDEEEEEFVPKPILRNRQSPKVFQNRQKVEEEEESEEDSIVEDNINAEINEPEPLIELPKPIIDIKNESIEEEDEILPTPRNPYMQTADSFEEQEPLISPIEPTLSQKPPSQNPPRRVDIFEELRFRQKSMARSDPASQTLEQVLAAAEAKSPVRKRAPIFLDGAERLKDQVRAASFEPLFVLLRAHSVVGLIGLKYVLIQSDETLYAVQLFAITRLLFYQLGLRHLGNFGRIDFEEPIPIAATAALCVGDEEGSKAAEVIMSKKELLSELFGIEIEDGSIKAMPALLPGYTPTISMLPLFLARLPRVDFETETGCVGGVLDELAMLYAVSEEDGGNPAADDVAKAIKNFIMPELKSTAFFPPQSLLTDLSIIRIRNLHEMYHIFERN